MSLKAKLEAVIYAAEEPVTLAQLASLFAEEALEWKAAEAARLEADGLSALRTDGPEFSPEIAAPVEPDSSQELRVLPANVMENREEPLAKMELVDAGDAIALRQADLVLEKPESGSGIESPSPAAASEDAELEARRLERRRDREVREILRSILDQLIAEYADDCRGIEIREIAGGFRMGTKPQIHDAVRLFVKSLKPALKLSLPALETLAVIAYKQPVTAPEVAEIRGVDSAGVLGSLMSRKLIATAGRKSVIGRPMLYKTTKEFLLRFGLRDLNELPSMEEFEKIAAMELSETDDIVESSTEAGDASGELFANVESAANGEGRSAPEAVEQAADALPNTTAEESVEAAEEHALVVRQNAEEVEEQFEKAGTSR